jgi:tetratricopeptide (TPR) repeat protein
VINNQIFACGMLRLYGEVDANLEKLKKVKAKTVDDGFKIFTQYYLNKLILHTESGNFETGKEIIQEREKEKINFKKQIFQENFYLLYAYIYFGAKDYNEALVWLNKLLDMPKTIVRQDLQSVARIINLIVHFEMGNNLLLESLLRSTYRYLRKQDRFYEFESRILKFIRKSKDMVTKKEKKAAFIELKTELKILSEKESEKAIFRYFNFMAWLDSKINENDFAQEVQSHFP